MVPIKDLPVVCEGDDECPHPVVTTHRGMQVCAGCKAHWIAEDAHDDDYERYDSPHPNAYND